MLLKPCRLDVDADEGGVRILLGIQIPSPVAESRIRMGSSFGRETVIIDPSNSDL
jgi:hypothetical protein